MKPQEPKRNVAGRSVCLVVALLFCGLLSVTWISSAASGKWTQKADMPTARYSSAIGVVNGLLYAIGGNLGWGWPGQRDTVEAYDPSADTWIEKTAMPTGRGHLAAGVVDGIIYAIGGWNPQGQALPVVEAYDPVADTWSKKADMPTPRGGLSIGVVDGKVYAIGGAGNNATPILAVVEVYDPATDTWTKKADMPTPRCCFTAGVVDGKILVLGGLPIAFQNQVHSTVDVYEPATDTWTQAAKMLTPRARLSSTAPAVNGKIYVIGGSKSGSPVGLPTVEAYTLATDRWEKSHDMPIARVYPSVAVMNGKIYVMGGLQAAGQGNNAFATVDEYTLVGGAFSVSPQGKLAAMWAHQKRPLSRPLELR